MHLEIDVLKTFIAVAETGSVKFAAERVSRSPAAVSMQMKKLEQLIGMPVFHRAEGAMRLSDTGDKLMPHAYRLVWQEVLGRGGELPGSRGARSHLRR